MAKLTLEIETTDRQSVIDAYDALFSLALKATGGMMKIIVPPNKALKEEDLKPNV